MRLLFSDKKKLYSPLFVSIYLFILSLFFLSSAFGLDPSYLNSGPFMGSSNNEHGVLWSWNGKNFSDQATDSDRKVHVHLLAGETLYLGFSGENRPGYTGPQTFDNFSVQLRQTGGALVYGPSLITQNGQGWISTWAQNMAGPSQLGNPAGYNAYSYTATQSGDYEIEFDVPGNVHFWMHFYDMTIIDAEGQKKDGRIWSKEWNAGISGGNGAHAIRYMYTTDQVVYKIEHPNMTYNMGGFLSSNDHGPINTGNLVNDRRTQSYATVNATPTANRLVPMHRIFFAPPDSSIFPYATPQSAYAQFTNNFLSGCAGVYLINLNSTKAVQIEIHLDLDGNPGYQAGGADRILLYQLSVGNNQIPWDGLDGLGNPIVPGSSISYTIRQIPGILHYFYGHGRTNVGSTGIQVSYLNPGFSGAIDMYWDDTQRPGGVDNSASPCTGLCHTWTPLNGLTGIFSYNTWWSLPSTVSQHNAVTQLSPTVNISNSDTTLCPGSQLTLFAGGVSSGYTWEHPLGTVVASDSLQHTFTTTSSGYHYFVYNGPCGSSIDSVFVQVDGSGSQVGSIAQQTDLCEGQNATLLVQGSGTTVFRWQVDRTGYGDTLAPAQNLQLTSLSSGVYEFRAIAGSGVCTDTTPSMSFVVHAPPSLVLGSVADLCHQAWPVTLTNASPIGGIYSGLGTSNNTFDPILAGAGTHSITYTYASTVTGCSASSSFDITVLPQENAGTITQLSDVCFPGNNNLELTNHSNGPLTWQILRLGVFQDTALTGSSVPLSNLPAGTYRLRAIVGNNTCGDTSASMEFTVHANPTIQASNPSPICYSATAYTLDHATPIGGTYSGPGTNNNMFDPASAGVGAHTLQYDYTSPLTGCSADTTFELTVLAQQNAGSVNPIPDLCSPGASPLQVQGTTDSVDWQILRSGSFIDTSFSGHTIQLQDLTAGTYSFRTITSTSLCGDTSQTMTFDVVISPIIGGIVAIDPSDCDNDDGEISIDAIGPDYELRYSIDDGQDFRIDSHFVGLSPFNNPYRIVVQYDNGLCSVDGDDQNLVAMHIPLISNIEVVNPSNCQDNDGEINITASGASGDIEYSIDGGLTYFGHHQFPQLSSKDGPFEVRVRYTDQICELTGIGVSLIPPSPPVINGIISTDPTNCSSSDGTIFIDAYGASIEYSIDNGVSFQNSNLFNNLDGEITYNLIVRYQDSTCSNSGGSVQLSSPNAPVLDSIASSNLTSCTTQDGEIEIFATSSETLEYSINSGESFQTSPEFSGLASGTYQVLARQINGLCETSVGTVLLLDAPSPLLNIVNSPSSCESVANYGLTELLPTGGTYTGDFVANNTFTPSIAGPGQHSITYNYIDPQNGCSSDTTLIFTVNTSPVLTVDHVDRMAPDDAAVQLDNIIPQGGFYTSVAINSDGLLDPSLITQDSVLIEYSYTEDLSGCSEDISFYAYVISPISIPNVFTPNGDGFNDVWNIVSLSDYPDSFLQIYNRWGNLIWENKGATASWNGQIKGQAVPTGTYYYILLLSSDDEAPKTGSLTLMK